MKKQILAIMLGLSIVLSGCSKQSTESILQEVKKETKELKSGKATMVYLVKNDKIATNNTRGYDVSGDEKFEPLEFALKGKYIRNFYGETKDESYLKDGVYYIKMDDYWFKKKGPTDNRHAYNFKVQSINMRDDTLNLLDNKDNWDITKDGDKVTFRLKKTDELKNKVKEERFKSEKNLKFSEFDYTIEYVFNTKTNDIEKLVYEVNSKTEGATSKTLYKGSLEEINKEVKIELPEESKKALEMKD